MESLDDLVVPVELKYCERCGVVATAEGGQRNLLSGVRAQDGGHAASATQTSAGGGGLDR
jgi:hypothetical protein